MNEANRRHIDRRSRIPVYFLLNFTTFNKHIGEIYNIWKVNEMTNPIGRTGFKTAANTPSKIHRSKPPNIK